MTSNSPIRTRMAPSPTGPLHIGTARSALFNYAFARKSGGVFVLRIEDTDVERSRPEYEQEITSALGWLKLEWDEFYRQSERLDLYERYLRKLHEAGAIFWCPHTAEDREAERTRQAEAREAPLHHCDSRDAVLPVAGDGVLRFKNTTDGDIVFHDLIRGEIRTRSDLVGDFSVAKDFRTPLYNFAVVIDDADMRISHVIRGEDHISNTPKQILLQRALKLASPLYAHLPLVLGTDRSKLSKRHGPVSLLDYERQGYLPEAIINFLALLGWHPPGDKDFFTLDDFLRDFTLERVQKAGAVFDIDKLNFLNREHLRALPAAEAAAAAARFAPQWKDAIGAEPARWQKIVLLAKERMTTLADIGVEAELFFEHPKYEKELLSWKGAESGEAVARHLNAVRGLLAPLTRWEGEDIEAAVMPYANAEGRGEVLWPFRAALSGRKNSPGPFEIASALGREETVARLDRALALVR